MCFCSETEKVHFYLSSEHDAPMCSKLKQCKKQMCSRTGDTSAAEENVEIFTSDTACGVAEQTIAGENVESSRVVPTEHLCAVKV